MPIAESSPPIVVGIKQTSSATTIVSVTGEAAPAAHEAYCGTGRRVTGRGQRVMGPSAREGLDADSLCWFTAVSPPTLASRRSGGRPPITGAATCLRQLVHNRVRTALDVVNDHPPADRPARVLVRTDVARHEDGSIRAVRLVVRDNGPGFSDKILKRAFEPYVTTKAKGTGLGLAVVKKIADEHHALVRIRNLENPVTMASPPGKPSEEVVWRGAQVSLSFSKLSSTLPLAGTH